MRKPTTKSRLTDYYTHNTYNFVVIPQFLGMSGERGMRDGFGSLVDTYGLFSLNPCNRKSKGIERSASIAPLLGKSGSDLTGVSPLGS